MKKILFVCSGNTCRSPLAEACARQVLAQADVAVSSAGTSAVPGSPAAAFAVEVVREHGMDLTSHRAQLLDTDLVQDADLIVAMDVRHREAVGMLDPDAREYTVLLTSFSQRHHGDIPDPIGGPVQVYQRSYAVIRDCVESMGHHLPKFDGWRRIARDGAGGRG